MDRRNFFSGAVTGGLVGAAAMAAPLLGRPAPSLSECGGSGSAFVAGRDGTALFVRDWGAGKPLLFLSGWALPSDFWQYQMLAAAQNGYRAVAYDRRGHGRSADPGRGYDHESLADDLAAVIAARGLSDVTLIAHSMGGTEVARYFARHGGHGVSRVALISTITPFLMKGPDNVAGIDPALLAALNAPLRRDFPAWVAKNTPPFFTPDTSAEMKTWGQQMMLMTSLLAAAELAEANARTDFRADVRRIGVPTLLIHGDRDASAPLPLTAQATAALLPNGALTIYEGAPHGLPLTHGERLNADMLRFVRG
ncbi:alpha/beta fold hydrolase [Sphingopyxis sp. MWB1]|uniref:alpha/beta fold hydrolase n=1 Tax=Sphingopyxis sp. MWB1 TaxID=1537715 RepID=UPI000A992230|nr:alpha/beta hydrolase [Sphingopyxis sp. MWB1]